MLYDSLYVYVLLGGDVVKRRLRRIIRYHVGLFYLRYQRASQVNK
jgi:hypothetical protein